MASNSGPSNSPLGFSFVLHKSPFTTITSAATRQPLTAVRISLLTPNNKNHSLGNPDVELYYEPDLGVSLVNFRDVLLHSQSLAGITMSMQRNKLETELKKVKNLLSVANGCLQNVTKEREQFDDANNQLLVHFKSKDALGPAIAILREHAKNLKRYDKAIDPDEEFLQDIEQRKSLEHEYLAAETKVLTIFGAPLNL
ncbi:unnamed protein product [Lactuca virosa]|uniref:Uncharacterized protein n=1 Tax=Lactuca virosa TaxID=75947 RepID=A0AAU9LHY0_9ASTR|nr:unnamed protein product [Lactuca virosa]